MLYQTHLQIHLSNIRANIESIQARIGQDRNVLIAVKANAYGHGAVEVARMAENIGVKWMGVATVPEGIALREAGIGASILKFGPSFPEEAKAALEKDLVLTVCDQTNAEDIQTASANLARVSRVHMKIDTGMGRVGVTAEDAVSLAVFIEQQCPNLHLEGLYTHLPVSDLEKSDFTVGQIERFRRLCETIEQALKREIKWKHCANSGAILGYENSWMTMVRPGLMIYGYYPGETTPHTIPLKPGLSFFSRVSFLKKVKAGISIGYGQTWQAQEDTWIATIPVGYADGFNRLFSNKGRVLINGNSYPVAGRVSMDQITVNLGSETEVKVGDEVVLIGRSGGEEISCDEWAAKLGTITYEVTCQINPRVTRYYD